MDGGDRLEEKLYHSEEFRLEYNTSELCPYILPLMQERVLHGPPTGVFLGGELEEKLSGFFIEGNFFHYDHAFEDVKPVYTHSRVHYLPLEVMAESIHTNGENRAIVGVRGENGVLPLVLMIETAEEVQFKGMYLDHGLLTTYDHDVSHLHSSAIHTILDRYTRPDFEDEITQEIVNPLLPKRPDVNLLDPKEIVAYFDEFVVGQEQAKKTLALAVVNHEIRKQHPEPKLDKANIMLVGPSGSGKTYLCDKAFELTAGDPSVSAPVSSLVGNGIVGNTLEDVILKPIALQSPDDDAPHAWVFMDEVDKLATSKNHSYGDRIQDILVNVLEGKTIRINALNRYLDTTNIQFIMAGAFEGGEGKKSLWQTTHRENTQEKAPIGFHMERKASVKKPKPLATEHFVKYGIKREIMGRVTHMRPLHALSEKDLTVILKEKKDNALHRKVEYMSILGYDVLVDESAYKRIVAEAKKGVGGRGIKSAVGQIFGALQFDVEEYTEDDGSTIELTAELIDEILSK